MDDFKKDLLSTRKIHIHPNISQELDILNSYEVELRLSVDEDKTITMKIGETEIYTYSSKISIVFNVDLDDDDPEYEDLSYMVYTVHGSGDSLLGLFNPEDFSQIVKFY